MITIFNNKFESLNTGDIKYDMISSYEDLKEKIFK